MTLYAKSRQTETLRDKTNMPIKLDQDTDPDSIPVRPGTNAHAILEALADHPSLAFSAAELEEMTDIPSGSIRKTLSRLVDKELVENFDGYYTIKDDIIASQIATVISLEAIEDAYGDDVYGTTDDWDEELPDLGESV